MERDTRPRQQDMRCTSVWVCSIYDNDVELHTLISIIRSPTHAHSIRVRLCPAFHRPCPLAVFVLCETAYNTYTISHTLTNEPIESAQCEIQPNTNAAAPRTNTKANLYVCVCVCVHSHSIGHFQHFFRKTRSLSISYVHTHAWNDVGNEMAN